MEIQLLKYSKMPQEKIWLSSPHMGGTEQKYVQEAFDTNWVAPLGPNVNNFETDLETYLNQNVFVGALSSGTAALHLGLILLEVKPGDEVICQSMTFSASANPIAYSGATPVFIDSEMETWNMCPIALEGAIKDRISKGKKPKAIIPVHLYGMPAKMDEIRRIANQYEIPILEDSAEALGSSYKNQKCGAMVTHTKALKDKAVFLSTQARDNAPHYQHSEIGYNYRMSNICAGIGRGQMEVLDQHVNFRRANHQFYKELFLKINEVVVFTEPNSDFYSNHWLSAILLQSYEQREALRLAFEAENIETRPLWKPMHLQPVFKNAPYYGEKVSESLFERGLCLPSGSNLTESDRVRISNVIANFFTI